MAKKLVHPESNLGSSEKFVFVWLMK